MKDCATAIFFWVKTMMNANKIVKFGQSVWWTTYDAAGVTGYISSFSDCPSSGSIDQTVCL